jgi:hypothetical protein
MFSEMLCHVICCKFTDVSLESQKTVSFRANSFEKSTACALTTEEGQIILFRATNMTHYELWYVFSLTINRFRHISLLI